MRGLLQFYTELEGAVDAHRTALVQAGAGTGEPLRNLLHAGASIQYARYHAEELEGKAQTRVTRGLLAELVAARAAPKTHFNRHVNALPSPHSRTARLFNPHLLHHTYTHIHTLHRRCTHSLKVS